MIQNEVFLREKDHRYFNHEGAEYLSVSKFLDTFEKGFPLEMASRRTAASQGVSQEEVLRQWKEKGDSSIKHGNHIHEAMESFAENFTLDPKYNDLEPLIMSVYSDYKKYKRIYSEEVLYSNVFASIEEPYIAAHYMGIAGTVDKLFAVTTRKDSEVDIEDFKTNKERGIEYHPKKGRAKMLPPIEHMPECNYTRYCLQLSLYAYLYEDLTGKTVRSLWIRFIPPEDKLAQRRIPVPYMKYEVHTMIQSYRGTLAKEVKRMNINEEPTF